MIKLLRGYRPRLARFLVTFLGLLTISAASFFMMGYLMGYPSFYTIPRDRTPVALPTSILFFALGTAIYLISASREQHVEDHLETDDQRIERLEKELDDVRARNHKAA